MERLTQTDTAPVETQMEKEFRSGLEEVLLANGHRAEAYHYQQQSITIERKTIVEASIRFRPWDPNKATRVANQLNKAGYFARVNRSNMTVRKKN